MFEIVDYQTDGECSFTPPAEVLAGRKVSCGPLGISQYRLAAGDRCAREPHQPPIVKGRRAITAATESAPLPVLWSERGLLAVGLQGSP